MGQTYNWQVGAQARKQFLSRAASPGRKPPITGGIQADLGRVRERPSKVTPVPFFLKGYTSVQLRFLFVNRNVLR